MKYSPDLERTPETLEELTRYVQEQLRQIQLALQVLEPETIIMRERNAEPAKVQEVTVAVADGTNWNPGAAGAGLYRFQGGAWTRIG